MLSSLEKALRTHSADAMNEKLISDSLALGASQKDAVLTAQVYLELCEVKKYWDVECKFCDGLQKLYVIAKETKSGPVQYYIPVALSEGLSIENIEQYFQISSERSVILVMVAADMTTVYYQFSEGRLKPEEVTSKRSKESSREKIDVEIHRNRELLKQSAMCGLPVTLRLEETMTSHR